MIKSPFRLRKEIHQCMASYFPKTLIFLIISFFVVCSVIFGQSKAKTEVVAVKSWSYSMGDVPGEQVCTDGNLVFVAFAGAKVEALSTDGKRIWASEFGGEITSSILVADTSLYFTTSTASESGTKPSTTLRWVSKETGITNWMATVPYAGHYFLHNFNGTIIVVTNTGVIESIDAKSGSVKWTRQIASSFVGEPFFAVDRAWMATTDRQIFGISMDTGEIESMRKLPFRVTALSEVDDNLIVGDERGNLAYYANGTDKAIWMFRCGGEITKSLSSDGRVLAASHDNFLYFLTKNNGGRVWKKRLSGRLAQIGIVPEFNAHYALAAVFGEHRVEVVDLSSGKVVGQIMFDHDEDLSVPPVSTTTGMVFFLTNKQLYAYSSDSFAQKIKRPTAPNGTKTASLK